jgi:hypothetical protein
MGAHMGRTWRVGRAQAVFLSLAGVLLLICGGATLLLTPSAEGAGDAELAAARARWAARPFTSYRMVIVDLRCRMQIEVAGERVVSTTPSNCPQGSRSVDELFQLIERDGTVGIACAYSNCSCDDVYHIRAHFDPQLGFPLRIEVRLTPTPNWRHPDYWAESFERRTLLRCDQVEGSKEIVVESLTPLQ